MSDEHLIAELLDSRKDWPKCAQCPNKIEPSEYRAGWRLCEQCEPLPPDLAAALNEVSVNVEPEEVCPISGLPEHIFRNMREEAYEEEEHGN